MEDIRIAVPIRLLKQFERDVRVIIKPRPDGVMLLERELLVNPERMREFFTEDVMKNFDVVLMPKM